MKDSNRIVFLDWLRVAACLMVMGVHSIEPFYLGNGGTLITCEANGFWSTILDSALRAAVPLFIMTSSYLLFPVEQATNAFLRKRLTRVGWPLLVWVVLYALIPLWGSDPSQHDIVGNLKHALLNFPDAAGHLWFMYMLIGVYLAMPIFSPWVEKLSKKGEQTFLWLWLFTTSVPFWRQLAMVVLGQPRVWGEAFWNEFGLLYYVSGFMGYVILGHYIKKYVPEMSWRRTLSIALPLWLVGYAVTAGWFWAVMPKSFPVSEPIELAVYMETSWDFCTLGVALTTIAYFLVARKLTADGGFYRHIIVQLSKLSFGMYLMHIFVLCFIFDVVSQWFTGVNPWTGIPVIIVLTALLTFCLTAILTKVLSLIPGSRYFMGTYLNTNNCNMENKNEKFMRMAIELAVENVKNGGGPFGAVIVKDDEVIATGVNRVTANHDPTAHAEVSAIRTACQKLKTFDLSGSTIYTSCEPCPMCLGAIYWARISHVFCGCNQVDADKIGFSDAFIYRELEKPMNERELQQTFILHEEALNAFRAWEEKEDKIEY